MTQMASPESSLLVRVNNDYPTRAVVLAAGRGSRLLPHTNSTPKPLLEVDGYPLLEWILTALAAARVTHVCLVLNHLADQIIEFVENWHGFQFNVCIRYQERNLGTANALEAAIDFIAQPVFVLAADYALPAGSLLDLKRAYHSSTADIVISLKEIPLEEVRHRSLVRFDAKGSILEIREKALRKSGDDLIGASLMYIVPPDLKRFLSAVPMSVRGEYELQDAVNAMIASGYDASGVLQTPPREWSPSRG